MEINTLSKIHYNLHLGYLSLKLKKKDIADSIKI
jgi:hypothetical protein